MRKHLLIFPLTETSQNVELNYENYEMFIDGDLSFFKIPFFKKNALKQRYLSLGCELGFYIFYYQ